MRVTVEEIVDTFRSLKDRLQAWKANQAQPLSEGQETGVTTDYVNLDGEVLWKGIRFTKESEQK